MAGTTARRRPAAPGPRTTPPGDVVPRPRRAATPEVVGLLARARAQLLTARAAGPADERYVAAHLAALHAAAALLAARGRPEAAARRRRPIRSAWEVLPEVVPELAEWSALFAAGAPRRARAEAGIPGAASARDADEQVRAAAAFLFVVRRLLSARPGSG